MTHDSINLMHAGLAKNQSMDWDQPEILIHGPVHCDQDKNEKFRTNPVKLKRTGYYEKPQKHRKDVLIMRRHLYFFFNIPKDP